MNNEFRLSNDLLNELNDEELRLLINIVPKEGLLYYIKKCPKKFRNETRGCRIDLRSKMLMDKLPKIYFDRIKKNDEGVIRFLEFNIKSCIKAVNDRILEVTSDEAFLDEAISSNDIDVFSKLLDIVLDILKPEYLKLFFKLINQKLSDEQIDYIDTQVKMICMKKELEREISERFKKEYEEEISSKAKKIKEINEELNAIKIELLNEKKNSHMLKAKVEEIETKKNNEIITLQNKVMELNNRIKEIEKEKIILKSSIRDKDEIIERLNEQLNAKYDEYSAIAQKQWNLENEELINIQERLKTECKNLEKTKELMMANIKTLDIQKQQLEYKISEYKDIVGRFIENIDKKLIEKALFDSLLNYSSNNSYEAQYNSYEDSGLYIKKSEAASVIEECSNINDFTENIAINLENIGVKNIADEVANYIIGVLAAGLMPLICGYRAREIATAISIAYSGETPYIISLPNGYTNSKRLLDIYNQAESNVVLIEDAVGTMNENALMPLLRERSQNGFSSKLLLLATENMDSVKYMPPNLYDQVALVVVDKYTLKKRNYKASDARKVLEEFVSSDKFDNEYKEINKIIKKLIYNLKLGNPYEILRTAVVTYSTKLSNSASAFEGYLRSELVFICKCHNTIANLEENIQRYQLGDRLEEIVRGGLYE